MIQFQNKKLSLSGQLLEAGTHDELMALQGAYYKLITMNVTLS